MSRLPVREGRVLSYSPLQIDVEDPQVSLDLGARDIPRSYSAVIREAFSFVGTHAERKVAVSSALERVEEKYPDSIRLAYFKARFKDEFLNDSPAERIDRWRQVVDIWKERLGEICVDGFARLANAYVEAKNFRAAVESFKTALEGHAKSVLCGQSIWRSDEWLYETTIALARTELKTGDAQAFSDGIIRMFSLNTLYRDLDRADRLPSDEAEFALQPMLKRAVPSVYERAVISALADRLTSRCACGSMVIQDSALTGLMRDAIILEAAYMLAPTDMDKASAFALAVWRDGFEPANKLVGQLAMREAPIDRGVNLGALLSREPQAAEFYAQKKYALALPLFKKLAADARTLEQLRARYWQGQCERHLLNWSAACQSFAVLLDSPDQRLSAWGAYKLAQSKLQVLSTAALLGRTPQALWEVEPLIERAAHEAPKSRRITFALGCLALSHSKYETAAEHFREVDATYGYYELAQWARCLALLHLNRFQDALFALSKAPASGAGKASCEISVGMATEIRSLAARGDNDGAQITAALFEKIGRQVTTDPAAWIDFFTDAALQGIKLKALSLALESAIDAALSGSSPASVIRSLIDIKLTIAESLGAAEYRKALLDAGLTLEALGENELAVTTLARCASAPNVESIAIILRYAGLLRDTGNRDEATACLKVWAAALHDAGPDKTLPLRHALGLFASDGSASAEKIECKPGDRLAIFGGSSKNKRYGLPTLSTYGFESKDITWLDADSGQRLNYSDCEALVKGHFDYYLVITSKIGHDTTGKLISDLKRRNKQWRPLAVRGKKGFSEEIGRILVEFSVAS